MDVAAPGRAFAIVEDVALVLFCHAFAAPSESRLGEVLAILGADPSTASEPGRGQQREHPESAHTPFRETP
jgi:hypothetical protein